MWMRFVAYAIGWLIESSAILRTSIRSARNFQNLFDNGGIVFIFFALWVMVVGIALLSWQSDFGSRVN
jgi:hypothetical protein